MANPLYASGDLRHDTGFTEVADRCWVARFEFLDVNVGLVGGDRGLLVVDTHASEVEALRVVEQVRRLGVGDVVAVVNTHQHFDHSFGNVVFSEAYGAPPVYAHESVPETLPEHAAEVQRTAAEDASVEGSDPRYPDLAATRVLLPTETFSSAKALDLGDRLVELVHPGRGHTAGDVVVRVGDADLLFAGDLVEESAVRSAVPGFGDDCFPMDWPATLDLVVGLLTESSTVVPGHGLPVGRDFVEEQRSAVGVVAETIRDLAGRGVAVDDALTAAEWPYPREHLAVAVRRGYEQLPRGARQLPLI
jgi:glyoxylase-like metal-dependent hydrolase (beta-lactamase superfamily II)